jgi:hypothetical protein
MGARTVTYVYRGYRITYRSDRPAMETWQGNRRGSVLSHNSEAMLRRMIDKRVREERAS